MGWGGGGGQCRTVRTVDLQDTTGEWGGGGGGQCRTVRTVDLVDT